MIGDQDPVALQKAGYYYVGKVFCLHGGEEQRSFKVSQLKRSSDPDWYTYIENGSTNQSGTDTRVANKVVPVYAQIESHPRCLVYLLDLYLSKLPQWAKDRDVFYARPSKNVPSNPTSPWYDCVPLGKEKLQRFVEVMCKEAGINEKKMNHSLWATGATAMFNARLHEKMIRDVTGHSSKALML